MITVKTKQLIKKWNKEYQYNLLCWYWYFWENNDEKHEDKYMMNLWKNEMI